MPGPLIAKYAKMAGCTEAHVEEVWENAKTIAYQRLKTRDGPKYWAYVNGTTQLMLGLKERGHVKDDNGDFLALLLADAEFIAEADIATQNGK